MGKPFSEGHIRGR